jgi:hypothetical protein
MSGFEVLPPITNPVELAAKRAEERALATTGFDISQQDAFTLAQLDAAAEMLGFIGNQYLMNSHRAFAIPASFNVDEQVTHHQFMGLMFEGDFACYSKIHVGKILGATSVRALCLTFHNVTLLPYFDRMEEGDLLHVPVLAVDTIDQLAA